MAAKGTGKNQQSKKLGRRKGKRKRDLGNEAMLSTTTQLQPYSQQHAEWLGGVKDMELGELDPEL